MYNKTFGSQQLISALVLFYAANDCGEFECVCLITVLRLFSIWYIEMRCKNNRFLLPSQSKSQMLE